MSATLEHVAATRLTREEKKAQTRERLLQSAAVVFARRGLAGSSLDEIAEEAGLTKGAVYSNFSNKEELVLAVLEERGHEHMRASLDHVDFGGDATVEARRAGDLYMRMEKEDPSGFLLWLETISYAARSPEFRARLAVRNRQARDEMADLIEETSREFDRDLPMTPDELATLFNALGNGLLVERLQNPDGVPDDLFGRAIALIYGTGSAAPS